MGVVGEDVGGVISGCVLVAPIFSTYHSNNSLDLVHDLTFLHLTRSLWTHHSARKATERTNMVENYDKQPSAFQMAAWES